MKLLGSRTRTPLLALVAGALCAAGVLVGAPAASADGGVTANNDAYSTLTNQTIVIGAPGVLANDTSTGGPLTAGVQTNPSRGTLELGADGSFRYQPPLNFVGAETFQYYAIDGLGGRAIGTVTVTINSSVPFAVADSYTVQTGLYLNVPAPGLLENDRDPSGGTLSVDSLTQPAHGALIGYTDGSFTYVSDANYLGTDTFTYEATNGTARVTATATILVSATGAGSPTAAPAPAGAAAAGGSLAALPPAPGASTGGGTTTTPPPTTGGQPAATAPDLKVTVAKKRAAAKKWALVATVANVGTGATTRKVTVTAVAAKGAKVTKVKAPRGWKCSIKKLSATCTMPKVMAKNAKAKIAYSVTTTKGTKRTVRVTALTVGDTVKKNNAVTVSVPAKG